MRFASRNLLETRTGGNIAMEAPSSGPATSINQSTSIYPNVMVSLVLDWHQQVWQAAQVVSELDVHSAGVTLQQESSFDHFDELGSGLARNSQAKFNGCYVAQPIQWHQIPWSLLVPHKMSHHYGIKHLGAQ